MKPIIHKITMLVAMLLSFFSAHAYDFEVDGIYYDINYDGETVAVTYLYFRSADNQGTYTGDIVIPSNVTYNGSSYSVTSIGSYAFFDCSDLTSIDIPNSVTSIEYLAFSSCKGLTSIDIPNSVTSIGDSAFNNCDGLTNIEIPNSVTSLGDRAFNSCFNLKSIDIPNSVTSIGDSAFQNCYSLTSIEIPNSVTSLGDSAFKYCSNLKSINIPNSVTKIGAATFGRCYSLTSIDIPNSVTSIEYLAFKDCTSLTSIEIPNSVTKIGYDTFNNCSALAEVYSYANTPPTYGARAFDGVDKERCILYVPKTSVDEYRAADGWKDFYNIEGVESGIEDVISDPAEGVYEVYNFNGVRVMTTTDEADFQNLAAGIYVINGKKYVIR